MITVALFIYPYGIVKRELVVARERGLVPRASRNRGSTISVAGRRRMNKIFPIGAVELKSHCTRRRDVEVAMFLYFG